MAKRIDECLFCTSRSCYERIVSSEDVGQAYDEIACLRHIEKLRKHSDETAPNVMKIFNSSTGKQNRKELNIFRGFNG